MVEITTLDFFLIIFLVLLNAFFVASEFAFVKVRITRINVLIAKGSRKAKRVKTIIDDLDRSLSSTQLGITLSSIALGFVGEPFFTELLLFFFHGLNDLLNLGIIVESFEEGRFIHGLAFFLGYLIVTFLHVVVGELAPKSISIQYAENTALWCAEPLYWFMKLTNPMLDLFVFSSNKLLGLLKVPPATETHNLDFTEDEMKLIIKSGIERGEIEPYESKLIFNILKFTDSNVKSIITPRINLIALPVDVEIDKITDLAIESGYSRIPVYEEHLDNIIGFVHVKDILAFYRQNQDQSKFDINTIIRPVITVFEGKPLDDLLVEMQKKHVQMSVIVDEYGTVEGIVTIEDILEYIFGPIDDEFDTTDHSQSIEEQDNQIVSGGLVSIKELNSKLSEKFGEEITTDDSFTLGGYILELFNSEIPELGMSVKDDQFQYSVSKVKLNQITEVKIRQIIQN